MDQALSSGTFAWCDKRIALIMLMGPTYATLEIVRFQVFISLNLRYFIFMRLFLVHSDAGNNKTFLTKLQNIV